MAKLDTNLSNKDKVTIAIVLFIGVVFAFSWYAIRPTIMSIRSLSDDIEQAKIVEAQSRGKVMSLSSAESVFDRVTTDLSDSTSDYYEVMTSSQLDRMATNYVLSFGLFPEDLYISMPNGPVEEVPYIYSRAAEDQIRNAVTPTPTPDPIPTTSVAGTVASAVSGDNSAQSTQVESLFVPYNLARDVSTSTQNSGVRAADLTLVMTGSESQCQALIDDLCTNPSLRVTGFSWMNVDLIERLDEETGMVEMVEPDYVRLQVSVRLYMADVADYSALVSDAVEAAGAEG
ncbi:MAG: hypothetical protein J6127_04430 [Clostridiales bacterium]|nr:hypothetical protein [Clostridiales bacterium]